MRKILMLTSLLSVCVWSSELSPLTGQDEMSYESESLSYENYVDLQDQVVLVKENGTSKKELIITNQEALDNNDTSQFVHLQVDFNSLVIANSLRGSVVLPIGKNVEVRASATLHMIGSYFDADVGAGARVYLSSYHNDARYFIDGGAYKIFRVTYDGISDDLVNHAQVGIGRLNTKSGISHGINLTLYKLDDGDHIYIPMYVFSRKL